MLGIKAYSVKKKQQDVDRENVRRGFDLALLVVTVALNNVYGFGDARLTKLEEEINRMILEDMTQDVNKTMSEIKAKVVKIRGR